MSASLRVRLGMFWKGSGCKDLFLRAFRILDLILLLSLLVVALLMHVS